MTGTWATGWATGDIVTAAEYKKSMGSISDTTLGGAVANVDITGISATYAHLLIAVYARGDTAAGFASFFMRFNADATASYDYQSLQGQAAAATAAEVFGATQAFCGLMPANTAGANLFGATLIFVPHYAGSANNKSFVGLSHMKIGVATTNMANNIHGGGWRNSAAVNRVTLTPSAGNFVAGTRVTVYGMGA